MTPASGGALLKRLISIIKERFRGGAPPERGDAAGPRARLLSSSSRRLHPSPGKHTQAHANTRKHTQTRGADTYRQRPTEKKEAAPSQAPASQLAPALIPPRRGIVFEQDVVLPLFVVCRPGLTSSSSLRVDLLPSLKRDPENHLLLLQTASHDWTITCF